MVITLKQFKKDNPELKSKKIILCEHLKNKSIDNVNVCFWIGENTRLLLCPICTKVHTMTVWDGMTNSALRIIEADKINKITDYGKWLEQAGKENDNAVH